MPFKSEKQRRWMHVNDPEMAKKWEKEEKKMKKETKVRSLIRKMVREIMKEDFAGAYPKEHRKKFDNMRRKQSEVLGYTLTGTNDIKTEIDDATIKEERDYKAEYKKYGSSTKAKKYRAELNAYNRKKGTYGNGDGKDASHKGGKIVGFEKESVNRGRAEKSRLKKEGKLTEISANAIQGLKDTSGKMWDYHYQEKPAYVIPFNEPRGEKIKVKDIKDKKLKVKIKTLDKILKEEKLTEKVSTLPPFEIAKRMIHSKYWQKAGKGFAKKVIRKFRGRGVSQKALDKWLPDYIDGKEISALFEGKLTEKVKYKKDKKIDGMWYTKQGTHKGQAKANVLAKREFGRNYDTKVVKEKGGYTIYVKPLSFSTFKKEGKLAEAKETPVEVARRIVQNKQHEKYKGMMLDTFTASAIVQVYDAVNDANKKKLDSLKLPKLVNIVWKLLKKVS